MMNHNRAPSPKPRSMDAGDLAEAVALYGDELIDLGYTRLTRMGLTDSARHFAAWLNLESIDVADVDRHFVDRFATHDCRCVGSRRNAPISRRYVNRVSRFVDFLVKREIVSPQAAPSAMALPECVTAFQDFLRRHRGLAERTIDRHGSMVVRLLPSLGSEPRAYNAGLVRRVILEQAGSCSPLYVKTMATALRAYLRFLAAQSLCPPGLDHATPTIAEWHLSTLPRYLPSEEVEQLIAACDVTTLIGLRDRAILLLLARLGLRAGDVADLRFKDIAWNEGTLRVCGKNRQEVRLPLPQDAGDALLAYIELGRPDALDDRIFLRVHAPYRPFLCSSSISVVVRRAVESAGIAKPRRGGAGLLRHSAATTMLRSGATLETVGAVLRHRSINTTAHYAKVDVVSLTAIAQPWPGDA